MSRTIERVDCHVGLEFSLPSEYTAPLQLKETIQLLLGTIAPVVNEPDHGHHVNKQPSCTFTKNVHLLFSQPVAQSMPMTLEFREAVVEEQPHVVVDLIRLDLVEDEYICCFCQEWDLETFSDV